MASTTSDLQLLGRKLGALDYNPDLYVKEIARRSVGGHDLLHQRNNIKTLSESTHSQLKKNVYQNYRQFIDTAKEIGFLEKEMYQLSHMITDQRNLLLELTQFNVSGDSLDANDLVASIEEDDEKEKKDKEKDKASKGQTRNDFEQGRNRLMYLLEKVEDSAHVMDVPTRFLLHSGDLVEMDVTENTALHRVHGYLTNDGFMVATWLPNRRGPVRYQYSCFYELDSLAVVNVRDLGGIKHTFKLLVTPDSRLFQCATGEAKQTWMDAFEGAKNAKKEVESAISSPQMFPQKKDAAKSARRRPMVKGDSTESGGHSTNPFFDEEDDIDDESESDVGWPTEHPVKRKNERRGSRMKEDGAAAASAASTSSAAAGIASEKDIMLPEWLIELPEDLEVYIAQREFGDAVDLVLKASTWVAENCHKSTDSVRVREATLDLENRTQHLIQVLSSELSTQKSFQGGPRTARNAVKLLCRLGRSSQAADLFLKHRDAILQASLKGGKLESATGTYVRRQAVVFFFGILESSVEFRKAFCASRAASEDDADDFKMSSLLVWVREEMTRFLDRIEKQVFSASTPLETISICVEAIREQCAALRHSGLDLLFLVDGHLRRNVERTICEHRDKHVDAVKLRAQEDKWEPINCFNKAGTERFLEEMATAVVPSVRSYVQDQCFVGLTRNTASFSLSYLLLADSLLRLFSPSMRALVNESLVTVFHAHLRHIDQGLRSERLKAVDAKFVQRNAAFLLDTLLSLVEHKYQEKTGADCPKLGKLHSSYSWLKEDSRAPSVASSSTTTSKYTDPNYV